MDQRSEDTPPKNYTDVPAADPEDVRTFLAKAETALQPGFVEILSPETRQTQRVLLVLAFVLLLITLDAVKFTGALEFAGLKFTGPEAKPTIILLGCIVCSYLEILVGLRCFGEWHSWRMKSRIAELQLDTLWRELDASVPSPYSREQIIARCLTLLPATQTLLLRSRSGTAFRNR